MQIDEEKTKQETDAKRIDLDKSIE